MRCVYIITSGTYMIRNSGPSYGFTGIQTAQG
nr:MAG TPA: hypothetical protein [Caudoviricetes sp.]